VLWCIERKEKLEDPQKAKLLGYEELGYEDII
jgi:hypothetical protein